MLLGELGLGSNHLCQDLGKGPEPCCKGDGERKLPLPQERRQMSQLRKTPEEAATKNYEPQLARKGYFKRRSSKGGLGRKERDFINWVARGGPEGTPRD